MTHSWWQILIACIGFGMGAEALRRYRGFKQGRRAMPYAERNAGFWTDGRLYKAEAIFSAAVWAIPFCAIIPMATADRDRWWLYSYPALLAYAFAIYLLMRGMNMDEPQ